MFNTSELDELFWILISIKGFKLRQPQWSNTTIPKHSIRYELNERAKERRKKSNIMKNAKILAKGIRADEEKNESAQKRTQ